VVPPLASLGKTRAIGNGSHGNNDWYQIDRRIDLLINLQLSGVTDG
jgi:hypothetical protein